MSYLRLITDRTRGAVSCLLLIEGRRWGAVSRLIFSL
jgi:hypothetical protein